MTRTPDLASLRDLCARFAAEDPAAALWSTWDGADPDDEETLDCDAMSDRFATWLHARGVAARVVHVQPPTPEPWYSWHWFVVVDGVAVDWTARQFWNAFSRESEFLDPATISCPLVFAWPGPYPVPGIRFVEAPDPRPGH